MVPRRRNAVTTQSLRRSLEPVLVSGPITALADCVQGYNIWEAHVRPLQWTQGRNGSVNDVEP